MDTVKSTNIRERPTPSQARHGPTSVRQRLVAVLFVGLAVVLVVGSLVWRMVFVYNEYKVGAGVASGSSAMAQSGLHTMAVMRGIGLIVFGLVLLVLAIAAYAKEDAKRRQWTAHDTMEVLAGLACIALGAFLFHHDQYALVGLR